MRHAIADIRFTDEESSLICACGWDMALADSEALNEEFQTHREESGARRRTMSEGVGDNYDNEFQRRQRSGHATNPKRVAA